jgi:hypothetical protein
LVPALKDRPPSRLAARYDTSPRHSRARNDRAVGFASPTSYADRAGAEANALTAQPYQSVGTDHCELAQRFDFHHDYLPRSDDLKEKKNEIRPTTCRVLFDGDAKFYFS